ncbi:MAG: trypsin-like peptidase domain-containing protein [Clostridia bacterium]|nr:trypsin-like peptidase domain-containing protein [Clostridia bacterium]
MKKILSKLVALTLAALTCITFAGCSLFLEDSFLPKDLSDSNKLAQFVTLNSQSENGRTLLTRVQAINKVERSVVAIKMSYTTSSGKGSSSGSGVIIDNGSTDDNIFYVLTCHHVISSGGDIAVYVPDVNARNLGDSDYDDKFAFTGKIDNTVRKSDEISLIGGDQNQDIAVLKLDVTDTGVSKDDIVCSVLPPDSYEMQRGEDVFAIGNPGGSLPMTASNGIISYLDRESVISSVGYMILTQIDVQINHGSSGGGLYNYYGELIGITNAGSETLDGINYAIPYKNSYSGGFVQAAKQLIATYYDHFEEKNFGYVSGSWSFGITVSSSSSTATIASVVADSNAAKAGLKDGDVIVGFSFEKDGYSYREVVTSKSELESCMYTLKKYLMVGDTFTVEYRRYTGGWGNSYTTNTATVNLTEQLIFADTGYRVPEENPETGDQAA